MQTDNRFFDDIARVAGGALSTLTGIKAEVEGMVRQQFERIMADMNLITRDEFEAVQAMAAKARMEQEAMAVRIAALEASLADLQAAAAAADPAAKAGAKRKKAGPAADSPPQA